MTLAQEQIKKWGLTWYSDPGHGWLRVPMAAVVEAGVAGQISTCSYMCEGNGLAYLEEDCDATIFLDAVGFDRHGDATIPERAPTKGESSIRRLAAFQRPPLTPEEALRALVEDHEATGGVFHLERKWWDARQTVEGMAQ